MVTVFYPRLNGIWNHEAKRLKTLFQAIEPIFVFCSNYDPSQLSDPKLLSENGAN